MTDSGHEHLLRQALRSELQLRLRHTLAHGLKSPAQTIVSATQLIERKGAAITPEELRKYLDWIRSAATEFVDLAQSLLPPKSASEEAAACDLHALTEETLHLIRDEGALRGVQFELIAGDQPSVKGDAEDLKLAWRAALIALLDATPENAGINISLATTNQWLEWRAWVTDGHNPGIADFKQASDGLTCLMWHVARNIVREHGGELALLDAEAGFELFIRLPSNR